MPRWFGEKRISEKTLAQLLDEPPYPVGDDNGMVKVAERFESFWISNSSITEVLNGFLFGATKICA